MNIIDHVTLVYIVRIKTKTNQFKGDNRKVLWGDNKLKNSLYLSFWIFLKMKTL